MRIFLFLLMLASPAFAVQPDEILDDPVLEARARVISKELRCLVCRNENIDDSNAGLARDIRLLVRERLVAGDSNPEVLQYMVVRYGEFVLLRPTYSASNLVLWLAGPFLLLIGGGVALAFVRRKKVVGDNDLSEDEKKQLDKLLKD